MKTCSKCKKLKSKSEFHNKKNMKDGLCLWCKECKKAASMEYYKKNKEKVAKSVKAYRIKNKDKYNEYQRNWNRSETQRLKNKKKLRKLKYKCYELRGFKCEKCGETNPWILQIHHRDGVNKRVWRGALYRQMKENPKNFLLLCASCHVLMDYIDKTYGNKSKSL